MATLKASYAFDEQIALRKFQTFAQENDIIFTFGSVEKPDDTTLIIKNADYYDNKTKQRQQIETLKFNNVRQNADGFLKYETLEISGFAQKANSSNGETTVSIEQAFSDGIKFEDNQGSLLPSYIATADITNMTVETEAAGTKTKLLFPAAKAIGVQKTNLRNFITQSIELAPAKGSVTNKKEKIAVSLGEIKIKNMEQFGAQGFDIGLIDVGVFVMDMKAQTGEKLNFTFEGMTVENFFSPDLTSDKAALFSEKDLRAQINPLTVTMDGKSLMGWKQGAASSTNDKSTNAITSTGRIEGMYFDFTEMPQTPKNANLLNSLRELDLLKMVMNIEGTGNWNRSSGVLEISRYDFELEDGATFGMTARINGYTEKIARQFTKAIQTMNAEDDEKKKNALAFQAIAYLAGLTVERLEIILDDQSLLDRVVNLQARKLKQDPEQIKGIVGPMTTIMLTPYNVPELAAQASAALGTFMQGNKKLTLIAEPVGGLAVTEIIALSSGINAGSVTPADFAKRLNLTIKAE